MFSKRRTAAEVKNIILDSVDKVDSLEGLCVSGGRINAYKALTIVKKINNLN